MAQPLHVSFGKALEAHPEWTHLALATYLRVDRPTVGKWVAGVRPIPARIIDALPMDLRIALAEAEAASVGWVKPPTPVEFEAMVARLHVAMLSTGAAR